MVRTGNSANIVVYAERVRGKRPPGYLWVEVLGTALEKVDGKYRALRVPRFHGTVYRHGQGEVAEFRYEPRSRPKNGELSPAVVERLTREALA